MFNENKSMMEDALQMLRPLSQSQSHMSELVTKGLHHLIGEAETFDGCVDCGSRQTKHFFSELATLKREGAQDCWLCLLEDMALFFRERFLRQPEKRVHELEQRIMDFFESSGDWRPDDGNLVSRAYWVGLPEKLREEYRLRGSRSPMA